MKYRDPVNQSSQPSHPDVGGVKASKLNARTTPGLKIYANPGVRRRDLLRFLGGASIFSLLGCLKQTPATEAGRSVAQGNLTATEQLDCIVRPQQSEGPYFVDDALNRSDIRSDPSTGTLSPGIPLRLAFQISTVNDNACVPLEGVSVDIWHCDASGVYSDVSDRIFNTKGQQFLRGSQITNGNGMVEFVTIYPGWYPGRAVHIHFKIRGREKSPSSYEFTSQLYFDDALTNQVYAQAPYNTRDSQYTSNERDGLYQFGGENLILKVSQDAEGYVSLFKIGLEWS